MMLLKSSRKGKIYFETNGDRDILSYALAAAACRPIDDASHVKTCARSDCGVRQVRFEWRDHGVKVGTGVRVTDGCR